VQGYTVYGDADERMRPRWGDQDNKAVIAQGTDCMRTSGGPEENGNNRQTHTGPGQGRGRDVHIE